MRTRLRSGQKILARAPLVLVLCALLGCGTESSPPAAKHPTRHSAQMREVLRAIAERAPDENPYTSSIAARRLRETFAALPPGEPDSLRERLELLTAAGRAELRLGNVQLAIDCYRTAERIHERLQPPRRVRARLLHKLGVAWLQLAERQNCCIGANADSCIFPIQGGGVHTYRTGSQNAAAYFERVVRLLGPEDPDGLAAVWLLNVAHMTLGTWPDAVPKSMRIESASIASAIEFPRLRNIGADVELDVYDLAGGAIVEDFDGDGLLDVMTSCWDPVKPMHYFRNAGNGRFVEQTDAAGLRGLLGGLNLKQADYDNDGDIDVLVLRGAWLMDHGRHPNSLLRNDGHGHFEDVTFQAGLGDVHAPTQTAGWADYDLDGDLDLYVGNETYGTSRAPCQLYRNDGDGTFTDVASEAGVLNDRFTKGVSWGDYDGDGDPDLYVSNLMGPNRLYRNEGDGSFTDVAAQLDVQRPHHSFPVWFWDYDNDGALDLYVPSYDAEIGDVAAHYLGRPPTHEPSKLYKGNGRGGFRDATAEAGLAYPVRPMGSNFGDLDGDGFLDIYLGTGDPNYESVMPNVLFVSQGGKRFADVTVASGLGHLQKGHGVAFADLDNDGDIDLFNQLGGAYPGDRFRNALYENPGFGNRWITLKLEGRRSNRSAIGAHIHLKVEDEHGHVRSIHRHIGSGGSFGANPLRQTIGLGKARRILSLEVTWPVRDSHQRFETLSLDTALRIIEGQAKPEPLRLRPIILGKRP